MKRHEFVKKVLIGGIGLLFTNQLSFAYEGNSKKSATKNKNDKIKEKIFAILVNLYWVKESEYATFLWDIHLVRDMGMDSLDIVEFVMEVEQAFDRKIPDSILEKLVTVNDMVDYIGKGKIQNMLLFRTGF
jgi:acyl carrier protein